LFNLFIASAFQCGRVRHVALKRFAKVAHRECRFPVCGVLCRRRIVCCDLAKARTVPTTD
jgi:hypothetical protein